MRRKAKTLGSLFFGITSRTLMTISAGLLVLSYLSIYVNPAKAWVMTIFGLLFVPLLIFNAVLFLWAAMRRSGAALIPLAALLPAMFMSGKYFRFSDNGFPAGDAAGGLKIISYNVGRFALSQDDGVSRMACADSVMAFLRAQDADIICLQEFYIRDAGRINAFFSSKMKGYDVRYYVAEDGGGASGNVILSRYPAVSKGRIKFDRSANMALYADYRINGTMLRVYNCHLESYNISLTRLAKSLEKDYRKTFRDTEEKMRRSISRRPHQVEAVLKDIEGCPEDAVVTGDFNDTPMSYTYYRLSRSRKDSFVEAGHGSGATFSKLRPLLRIDYVLFPERFRAVSHEIVHKRYSDHYPVVAVIDMNEKQDSK